MIKRELIFLVLLVFIVPILAQQLPLDARLRGGKIHFQGGRYAKALEQFEAALKDFPDASEARLWKSVTLEKLGRYEESALNFDMTFTAAPELLSKVQKDEMLQYSAWNAFIKAGQKIDKEGNYAKALIFFKWATLVSPQNPHGYLLLSQIYTSMDSLEAIKRVAEALFAIEPTNHQVDILLGVYYFKKENWDSSMIYYGKAATGFMQDYETVKKSIGKELKLDSVKTIEVSAKLIEKRRVGQLESYISDSLRAKSKLMNIARMTEQLVLDVAELNICYFRSGVAALQKANSLPKENLQQTYLKLAEDNFQKALIYNPLDFDSKYNLGMTMYRAGLDDKAKTTFDELVSSALIPLNNLSEDLAQNLLSLITKQSQPLGHFEIVTPVIAEIEKELLLKQTYKTGYWYLYFPSLRKAQELPTSVDYGKIYLSGLEPDIIENLWLLLGATQTNLKQFDDAIQSFNTVLALNPKNQDAYRNLAVCYREKGDQKKAYEILQEGEKIKKQP